MQEIWKIVQCFIISIFQLATFCNISWPVSSLWRMYSFSLSLEFLMGVFFIFSIKFMAEFYVFSRVKCWQLYWVWQSSRKLLTFYDALTPQAYKKGYILKTDDLFSRSQHISRFWTILPDILEMPQILFKKCHCYSFVF